LTVKSRKGKNGEIRRATFQTPATYDAFVAKFAEVFGALTADQKLKFEDDEGDLVTLSTQSDYEEALRVVASSDPKILRITITTAHKEKDAAAKDAPRRCPFGSAAPAFPPFGGCARSGGSMYGPLQGLIDMAKTSLPELLNNPALRSMAEGMLQSSAVKIVQPYICDCCNVNISGDRFNSTVKPEFDLCKACMESAKGQELDKEHHFKLVTALEALVATLSNGGTFDAFFAPGRATDPEPVAQHHAICDVCNQPVVGVRHKCLDCADYDECNICYLRPTPHVEGHVFYSIEDPAVRTVPSEVMAQHKAKRELEETARREAAARVAAEEAAKVAAAEAARKAEEERMRLVKAAEEAAQEAAKAKAEAEVKAREAALLVKLTPAPVASAPPAEPEKEPSAFERNLQTLESMGFGDRKRNIQVLVRNRNKLFESIQELLG